MEQFFFFFLFLKFFISCTVQYGHASSSVEYAHNALNNNNMVQKLDSMKNVGVSVESSL